LGDAGTLGDDAGCGSVEVVIEGFQGVGFAEPC
jgi:hypothetical protein